MISEVLPYLTPAFVAAWGFILFIVVQAFIRIRYALRVRAAGGVHAPALGSNPVGAFGYLFKIGMAQAQNRIPQFSMDIFATKTNPENPGIIEINVTGGQRFMFSQEPEHIKTVLTGKFAEYGKGEEFHHVWQPFLGDSIFTTDHQKWQDSRNLIRPMFMKNRVSDLHTFERWTAVMMNQFPAPGQTFDIQDLFYRMTIDVITDFLLGESVNSLENPRSEFVQAFTDVQRMQTMLTVLMPIEKLVPRGKYKRGIKVMEDFIVPFIDKALTLSDDELHKISKSDKSFTFLHALANYTRDPKVIRDQIIAVLLAGRDTTAATLSWCFHELRHYPQVYAKLRADVVSVVGTTRAPTYEDLKNMKYLTHTINETLRLYPAVPFNIRFALTNTSLPSANPNHPDITVLAGDAVFYSTLQMQRRPDLYPAPSPTFAPADIFSPDRWDHWQPRPWQYVPFNGGPRICVGQNFALTEMAYVMVRLVQRYERLEGRDDWDSQYHKVEIVGTPGRGVKIAMFEPTDEKVEV
ncbi:putative cytochrome P450 [Eremomyces bilateralis CBS 781.70]|uniref:Cytochrome P450 n=1 Tax=Eremomyces bilateralis CBS 781.70 TaxID=1392243 RepID=A0A6G1GG73_9PEZI|nr:putative cytochrome P450 [Eremomyces bilateralis CBS 781.70]KAF1817014.1 putative cytochrome P450 [Eremomyces bilateralis CBS 781.70]